jgi:hypothetical protein
MTTNKCCVCGTEKDLTEINYEFIKTEGYPVFIRKGYICKNCKGRILKNEKAN